MLNLLADALLIAGICILTGALIPVRQLMTKLPPGSVRHRWYILTAFIVIFIVGYISYAMANWGGHTVWPELIVPSIFFFGAGFVWLTITLSLQTAKDIRRVALLEHENVTDSLIGIYNRRYLDRRLEEEFARARRYALPLSVLLLDIDHFKHINDTYGHQVGDRVLNALGPLLLRAIRESDIVARYGGEELLIIAPHTLASLAVILAERVRQDVATQELALTNNLGKRQTIRITISIGIAGLDQEVTDSQRLVHNADEALYRAKQEGRNRIVIYDAGLLKPPRFQMRE